ALNLKAHPGLERIILTWEVPSNMGGKVGVDAKIWRGGSPDSVRPYASVPVGETRFEDDQMSGGNTYYYMITLTNTMGEGSGSNIVFTTAFGLPSAPSFTDTYVRKNEVRLNWSEPEWDGGSEIIGYLLQYRREGEIGWEEIEVSGRSYTFTNLIPGKSYSLMVKAENLITSGNPSEIENLVVGEVPMAPVGLEAAPGSGKVTLSWDLRSGIQPPATNFRIYMGMEAGEMDLYEEVDVSTDSLKVEGLMNGVNYSFVVSCVNKIGEGTLTDVKITRPKGIPGIVDDIWIEETGDGYVKMKWTEPGSDGGSKIVHYNILRGRTPGSGEPLAEKIMTTEFIDEDVENGKIYYYMVEAKNAQGIGKDGVYVDALPMGDPMAPVDLKASVSTDSVRLTWSPPYSTGGSEIIGYLIMRTGGSSEPEIIADLGPDSNTFVDEGVVSGSNVYSIRSYTSAGASDPAVVEVDVPSRTGTALLYGAISAFIPLAIVLMIIILPGYLRKRKERKEEKLKAAEEEEKRIRQMRAENLLGPKRPPSLAPAGVPMAIPGAPLTANLPPVRQQEHVPLQDKQDEGYIRPTDIKKKVKDKKKILRADGRSIEYREKEDEMRQNLRTKNYQGSHEWEHEHKKVLEKEAKNVFTGQQLDHSVGPEMKAAPAPMQTPPAPEMQGPEGNIPMQKPPVTGGTDQGEKATEPDNIARKEEEQPPVWGESEDDNVPLSQPPEDPENLDEVEEIEELEEMETA
ncbi:MAG: fibronectin type III domain-containing protein, partial [Candidatus Thermoplasmatota archaeon]|nr:fibronectin type III domain-containing protein [Candidatus Thermoplasmatota archaeon]